MPAKGKKKATAKRPPKKRATDKDNGVLAEYQVPPPSPLRGLVPTPPEVVRVIEELSRERPYGPEYRLLATEEFKMQYYFGGHHVAYRETPQGYEVLAVGNEEVDRLWRRVPRAKRQKIRLWWYPEWPHHGQLVLD